KDERDLLVGHRHHRFQSPQIAVGAPILGELDAGTRELARMLLELRLEPLEEGQRVGGGAGEAGHHRAVAQPAQLPGVRFDDGLAHRYLAVPGDHHPAILSDAEDGRTVPAFGLGVAHGAWVAEGLAEDVGWRGAGSSAPSSMVLKAPRSQRWCCRTSFTVAVSSARSSRSIVKAGVR